MSGSDTASVAKPITHARVLAIALTIVISNATVPILGIVDTAVVGQLGEPVPTGNLAVGTTVRLAHILIGAIKSHLVLNCLTKSFLFLP